MPPHTNLSKLGVILGDFCKLTVKITYSEGVRLPLTTGEPLEVDPSNFYGVFLYGTATALHSFRLPSYAGQSERAGIFEFFIF